MSLEKRRESLKRLLYEALEELRSSGFEVDNIIVYVSPRDRELIKDLLREIGINGEVVEDRDIVGGLRVSTRSGEMSVDNTYNSRLERALRTILPEIFKGIGVE
jgi:vacuolar-type H+-ATPase subunit E/Vma4